MGQKPGVQTRVKTPLARQRVEAGLTQAQLAGAAGIPLSTYRRLERGRVADPAIGLLVRCASALDVELDELLTDEQRRDAARSASSGKPGAHSNGTHSQPMGRARGLTTAAVGRPRRRSALALSARQQHAVTAAADGNFEPFLAVIHAGDHKTDAMLDSGAAAGACVLAVNGAQTRASVELDRRLDDAGIEDPDARQGVVTVAGELAAQDLQRALDLLVERRRQGKTAINADSDALAAHAEALLVNRLAQALGQDYDAQLQTGSWPALHLF